jgi:superfamily I DNA/RNA helicase
MELHPDVQTRLDRLTPDQRAAATAPPGPVLCLAPAGSGKTTTLVARIAWLVATGTPAEKIAAIAFNKRAADELAERVGTALEPLGVSVGTVRVRTFHAFGREILRAAGQSVEPLVDRDATTWAALPGLDAAERRRLDTVFSTLKLEHRVDPAAIEADPEAGPRARAFVAYEAAVRATGGLDFDDLVARPLALLEREPALLAGWRADCQELLVDEVQDVDRSQLELALLIAAPNNRIFLVGDDDQSIYGWRLADVRRVLALAERLPGLRRHDLVTNFRCPAPVVERAVRLVEHNVERFAKTIVARAGAGGRLVLAPDPADDDERVRHVIASWPTVDDVDVPDRSTRAFLARTNRELLPAAAVALELMIPFRAERLELPLEDSRLDPVLARLEAGSPSGPLLIRLARMRDDGVARDTGRAEVGEGSDAPSFDELLGTIMAWAAPYADPETFAADVRRARTNLVGLRRDDALLTLATAHSTKGLEFDHVAVIDLDVGRFPSQRTLDDANDPGRALEEERRLAYVAWTRARRSLTLVYDPAAPSPFLFEAFSAQELLVEDVPNGSPQRSERTSQDLIYP